MTSRTTKEFRELMSALPANTRAQARKAYRLFEANPQHPGLRFKKVHATLPIYSARVSQKYRAVGVLDNDEFLWFWIGAHADYDQLLKEM